MPTFYVHLVGEGEGCDYCISCNETVIVIEAEDMEAAKKKVARRLTEYSSPSIAEATIVQAAEVHEFDVAGWRKKRKEVVEKKKQADEKEKRRQDYEKLKVEFEETPEVPPKPERPKPQTYKPGYGIIG